MIEAPTMNPETPRVAANAAPAGTVCHVVHSLGVGGAEVLVADMIRSLNGRFNFTIAVLDDIGSIGESLIADGFLLTHLKREDGIDWRCARRLNDLVIDQSIDILHVHQCTPMFQAMMSRAPFKKTPILLTEHGRHHPDMASMKRSICHKLLLSKRDRLVAVGKATREALIANEGLPAERVEVVYNGVDLSAFRDVDPGCRDEVRSELNLTDDDLVMTLVARLDAIKDHSTAIDTALKVREQIPNAKLLLAGDGPEREHIEQMIRDRQAGDCVRLLGVRRDIPRLLAASDTFLMTSISEGIPLTIIEAMAASVPIVSTNVGGIPEMVDSGETGLLADSGDSTSLAQHIVNLAKNQTLRSGIVDRARDRAFEVFSREQMLETYSRIYEEMLNGR